VADQSGLAGSPGGISANIWPAGISGRRRLKKVCEGAWRKRKEHYLEGGAPLWRETMMLGGRSGELVRGEQGRYGACSALGQLQRYPEERCSVKC
jgi:hypothetical protein